MKKFASDLSASLLGSQRGGKFSSSHVGLLAKVVLNTRTRKVHSFIEMEVQRTAPSDSSKRATYRNLWFLLASVGSLILVFAAYSNFFDQSFQFGDRQVIQQNLYVRGLESIPQLFSEPREVFSLSAQVPYRPVLSLSFSFDQWMAGTLDPRQFHLTNLF